MILESLFAASPAIESFLRGDTFGVGFSTTSGEKVSPESALKVSAYFACVRCISEDTGKLPRKMIRRHDDGTRTRVSNHPVSNLFITGQPNSRMTGQSFIETLTGYALSWGNGIAEIQRSRNDKPVALWPIHPSRVDIKQSPTRKDKFGKPELEYHIRDNMGVVGTLPARDVFHIHNFGLNGFQGLSIAQQAAQSIGVGLAAEKQSASFFGNGSSPSGFIKHPGTLTPEARQELRQQWSQLYSGAANAYRAAVLDEGMTWEQLTVNAKDAQFIETMKFNVAQIARWFRVPPHKIGHLERSTFSNIEVQNTEYFQDTLSSWIKRWETEIKRQLIEEDEPDIFFKIEMNGILLGDINTRRAFYKDMWSMGAMNSNEMRGFEDMDPTALGDLYYVPLNFKVVGEPDPKSNMSPGEAQAIVDRKRMRADAGAALWTTLCDNLKHMVSKECNMVAREFGKKGDDDHEWFAWLGEFYIKHERHCIDHCGEVVRAIAEFTTEGDEHIAASIIHDVLGMNVEACMTMDIPIESRLAIIEGNWAEAKKQIAQKLGLEL